MVPAAQRVMWFKVVLLALYLSQLGLGAAQECEGFVGVLGMTPDQLKKEIRANVAAALRQGASVNSGNETCAALTQEDFDNQLEKAMNVAIQKINSTIEKVVNDAVAIHLTAAVDEVIANVSNTFEQLVSPIMTQLQLLRLPGSTPSHPATSCKEIKELNSTASSGYYWLRDTGDSFVHMYCDMSRSCGGITGGWMRVTKLNMTNSSHTCPAGLKLLTTPNRLCAMNIDEGGCSSATFNLHGIQYTHVCGKIIGYQQGAPDAFSHYSYNRHLTIDDIYVDGISLTHGRSPRKHIWTFAAALHEIITSNQQSLCPCINVHNSATIPIPPYVGSDYFCDTASENRVQIKFYPNDPLWDGQGCGRLNTCCAFNNPPWFMKELPSSTSDDIEMRLCTNHVRSDEDINFEILELYVQ